MTRNLQAAIAVGLVCVFLGAIYLGTEGGARRFFFILFVLSSLLWGLIWFPEGIVSAYFFAGQVDDPRLHFEELPLSINQMLLISIAYLLLAHRNRLFLAMRLWSVRGLVMWVLWLSLALLWSMGPEYGQQKTIRHLGVVLPALMGFVALVLWRGHLFYAILSVWGLGIGLTVLGLFKFLSTAEVQEMGRLSVLGGGPNIFARLVGMGLLFSLAAFGYLWRRQVDMADQPALLRSRLLLLFGVTCLVLMAAPSFVLAQSRGPALSLVVALGVYAVFQTRAGLGRVVVIALVTAAGIWLASFTLESTGIGNRFDPSLPSNLGTVEARRNYLDSTLDIIVEHPRVGVGTGGWPVAMYGIDHRRYPHNLFVEIAAEQGLVACGLVIVLFGLQVMLAVNAYLQLPPHFDRELVLVTLVLFVYILMTAQVSGDAIDNRHVWQFLLLMELARRKARMGSGFGLMRSAPG